MLRFAGALLLIGLLLYLCLLHTRREERRVRECEGFLLLVRHIRAEIGAFRTPLDRAIAGFGNPALEEAGLLPLARERGLGPALEECCERLLLDGEDMKCLLAFAEGVGKGYTQQALALCERTEGALSSALEKRKSEAPARARTGQALLLFGGLSLLLLLG